MHPEIKAKVEKQKEEAWQKESSNDKRLEERLLQIEGIHIRYSRYRQSGHAHKHVSLLDLVPYPLYFLPEAFCAALVTLPAPPFSVLATDLMTPTATVSGGGQMRQIMCYKKHLRLMSRTAKRPRGG